jgi:DNA-binding transcriptional regulator YhcF (GntR family)
VPTTRRDWLAAWAIDGRPGISSSRALVALAIVGQARVDGTRALAGVPWLAAVTGLSVSTVQRATRQLRAEGWIVVHERGHARGTAKPTSTIYDLAAPGQQVTHDDLLTPLERQQVTHADVLTDGVNRSNGVRQQVTQDDVYPTPNGVVRAHARAREAPDSGLWPLAPTTTPPADVEQMLESLGLRKPTRKGKRST